MARTAPPSWSAEPPSRFQGRSGALTAQKRAMSLCLCMPSDRLVHGIASDREYHSMAARIAASGALFGSLTGAASILATKTTRRSHDLASRNSARAASSSRYVHRTGATEHLRLIPRGCRKLDRSR